MSKINTSCNHREVSFSFGVCTCMLCFKTLKHPTNGMSQNEFDLSITASSFVDRVDFGYADNFVFLPPNTS